jgi:hypothetical protein
MAYNLIYSGNQTGGNANITVSDGSAYSIGNVTLPGRNFNGYGAPVDQNMLSLAENFASQPSGPSSPVTGQLWYDITNSMLKYNISTGPTANWVPISASSANANTTSGNANVTGNITVGDTIIGNTATFSGNVTVTGNVATVGITAGSNTTGGTITGAWTLSVGSTLNSTYADLAERHHADGVYSVGTVMSVGGTNEITAAQPGTTVLGVVSEQYAYLMNDRAGNSETHPAVAYLGRVPVRVVGPVERHSKLTASADGTATIAAEGDETFGWALETNTNVGEKLVLCIIK